jgi:hypothetical protein
MNQTTCPSKRLRIWGYRLLLVFTFLSVAANNIGLFENEFVGPNHVAKTEVFFQSDRIDVPPILQRASQCTTFLQTRSYWHEDYTPGVPFYRPLSLTAYWLEYHAFGAHHFSRWTLVTVALELCFCFLLATYVRQMTGSLAIALFTVFLYAGFRQFSCPPIFAFSMGNQNSPSDYVIMEWKNQPALFADCSILAAALLALRKKWVPALCIAVMSIFFKESGWIVYAFVFLTLLLAGKLPETPKWVYAATVICIAIPIMARHLSGMGYIGGLTIGSNQNWEARYLTSICGVYIKYCTQNEEAAVLLGTSLYFLFILRRESLIANFCIVLALFVCAVAVNAVVKHTSFPVSLTILLDPSMQLWDILVGFMFTAACHWLIQFRELGKYALQFFVMSMLAGLLFVSATQVGLRALNLCFAMQSAIVATAWVAGVRRFEQN